MKKFWEFKAQADNAGELLLYGEISDASWWGDEVTPKQFKKDLDGLGDMSALNIYINSGGGDVFAGQAIYSMLKRHSAKKNVYIDGLAASMASVIAMVGDNVYMPSNAMMMVHNPWTVAMGNATDFRAMADTLDKIRESSIAVYREKTGMEDEEIIALLDAETWMTAEDAVAMGFADEIEDGKQVSASICDGQLIFGSMAFDLSRFKHLPMAKIQFYMPPKAPDSPVNPVDIYVEKCRINERRLKHGF
ncbi:MAG: ATP-dependent Clp protease proteolytic subunit [Firmicutes bacterium]|nr:ATP-dependent Clp protease proteolytic subunit [Bacillota bacterium]